MARSKYDLHNTANKDDELDPQQMRRLLAWWNTEASPLLGTADEQGGVMADQRDTPVVIIAVDDDLEGLRTEAEKFGPKVHWVTVPPDLLKMILESLNYPEQRVRRGRPQRKKDSDEQKEPEPGSDRSM